MSIWRIFITLSLWALVSGEIKDRKFGRELVSEDLEVLASYQGYRSSLECAVRFFHEKRQNDDCLAYTFDPESRTCFIYKMEETHSSQKNLVVYKYYGNEPYCATSDGFQQFELDGQIFCHAYMTDWKVYDNANSHCKSLGAYLLHYDKESEIDIVNSKAEGSYYWIGGKKSGGIWISEKDQTPLTDLWPEWSDHTTANGYCLSLSRNQPSDYQLFASTCFSGSPYICERTVLFRCELCSIDFRVTCINVENQKSKIA